MLFLSLITRNNDFHIGCTGIARIINGRNGYGVCLTLAKS